MSRPEITRLLMNTACPTFQVYILRNYFSWRKVKKSQLLFARRDYSNVDRPNIRIIGKRTRKKKLRNLVPKIFFWVYSFFSTNCKTCTLCSGYDGFSYVSDRSWPNELIGLAQWRSPAFSSIGASSVFLNVSEFLCKVPPDSSPQHDGGKDKVALLKKSYKQIRLIINF